jgi:hypothetical protein
MQSFTNSRTRTPVVCTAVLFASAFVWSCGGGSSVSSPTGPDTPAPTQDPASATSLTFAADIQPILNNDCVSCHGGSRQERGYDFRTYSGVMRAVTPGNANSILVQVTRPGGLMYQEFRGSASAKAETIRRWVVDFNAAQ